eukprot:CAMPEP_0177158482 /NCGR_PEP_ID=MMETSP0367-20130122/3813_1 /TAXON_ID=447022 ORGANISM="Scrippsiella hangoei-like, Strain SHHI-4" /NCGR_SAMPLE_ID=MMETSP0367 /ASSEMBLY_ACC=CAM_ASM_000362 /LENGTH=50 /DNA_ID=CAMNT_0018604065 /DNA_START=717 /DNA_END=866 /DNA_ORIENTATION=-
MRTTGSAPLAAAASLAKGRPAPASLCVGAPSAGAHFEEARQPKLSSGGHS